MTRATPRILLALLTAVPTMAAPAALDAQGLPVFAPINPVATSRSGVYFEPYRAPHAERWELSVAADYASMVELNTPDDRPSRYVLDAEVMRVGLRLARDLSPAAFVLAGIEAQGAYAGVFDGFLDWYHDALGLRVRERDKRPHDVFTYDLVLPDGEVVQRQPAGLFLGDLRAGIGVRLSTWAQTVVSLTLPTATGPPGYGRGVPSFALLTTARTALHPRVRYEGSIGLGYTPSTGPLQPIQRDAFLALSSGLTFRPWGRQWLYANLFYHSPYYYGTTLRALDRKELSLDFGWMLLTRGGREWRIGLTEDPDPGGPAVDLILRLGARF